MLGANTTLAAAFTITFKNFSSAYLMSRLVHDIPHLMKDPGSILIKIILYVLFKFYYLTDFAHVHFIMFLNLSSMNSPQN
jgi:hypothetical protein